MKAAVSVAVSITATPSIALSGDRNKSGRNRIVPIPEYVKEELVKLNLDSSVYLFSKKGEAYSKDYFSVEEQARLLRASFSSRVMNISILEVLAVWLFWI